MSSPTLPTSGPWAARPRATAVRSAFATACATAVATAVATAFAVLPLLSGCLYSLSAGSGFPAYIRTVAVLPFENETTRFDLTQQIHDVLLRQVPRSLGVRNAGENEADAVVRGTIRRYSVDAPLFRPGETRDRAEVLQRSVTISVHVEIIDQVQNVVLWEDPNVQAQGQYLEASETEDIGREEAIELLVQRIVDGAQSNW